MVEFLAAVPLEAWGVLCEMAPYLLFGFAVAGLLSVFLSPSTIDRHLGGRGVAPVFKAALFGVPLPLCSCGVIPVAASLRRHGASRGATTAFLLSTPQTGVDSILVTLALLGPVYAVFRPIAAFVSGLAGGLAAAIFGEGPAGGAPASPCEEVCCTRAGGRSRLVAAVEHAFVTLPRDIGKPLIVGLLAVGLISAFVPDDYLAGALGTGFGAMVVMMLLGLPVYVCATATTSSAPSGCHYTDSCTCSSALM